jgi:hypothetical protein
MFCKPREKCSGACLFRKSSDDGRGSLEDPHRPPRLSQAPPALVPRAALPAPRELLPESLPAILCDADEKVLMHKCIGEITCNDHDAWNIDEPVYFIG